MASDAVEWALEKTVPELEDWESQELFSPAEISAVVRQRRDFEYKLNRR